MSIKKFHCRFLIRVLIVSMLGFGLSSFPSGQAESRSIVINELLWMGSALSSADEWIELRNTTDASIDLSDWRMTKLSSGTEKEMLTIQDGTIEAYGYFLISNYDSSHGNSSLQIAPDVVDTDVTLSNSALQIRLYDADGLLVDVADDGSGKPLAGKYDSSSNMYYSMERNTLFGDGSLEQNWHTSSVRQNVQEGTGVLGTPGAENSNAPPVVEAGTDQSGVVGEVLLFDASDTTDADGDTMTFVWDFGDSTTGSGVTPSHIFAAVGEYIVTVTVDDGFHQVSDTLAVLIAVPPAVAPTEEQERQAATSCAGARLSELWPNPAGVDDGEFVELENITGTAIALSDCKLWVNEKRVYTFDDETVPARGFLVAEKSVTKLSLTNDGAVVRLEDSDGTELDRAEYAKAKDDLSWSRFADSWGWTETPTPGSANAAPQEDGDVAGVSSGSQSSGQVVLDVVIGEIQELDSGEPVHFIGTITAPVGVLGNRVTFIQDQSGGVSLLLSEDGEKPEMGNTVAVSGIVRSYQGRKRVSVKAEDLQILEQGKTFVPRSVSMDELIPELADQLVTVSGVIGSASGSKITLDDGSAEGVVYLKSSTGILKPKMSSGDRLTVTGIVNFATASGVRVLPRTTEDLQVERVLAAADSADTATTELPAAPPHQTFWYWVLVGLGILAASAKPLWKAWRERHRPDHDPADNR